MTMPISALNGTGLDILMWVYPEWSQMGHTYITALLEKYEFICMYLFPTLGRVFTSNFSLAKINCHRNFGKVSAFTHSNEKLKTKFVEESLLTYFVTYSLL